MADLEAAYEGARRVWVKRQLLETWSRFLSMSAALQEEHKLLVLKNF